MHVYICVKLCGLRKKNMEIYLRGSFKSLYELNKRERAKQKMFDKNMEIEHLTGFVFKLFVGRFKKILSTPTFEP